MNYYNLNDPSFVVDFRKAVCMGQAPNKGLFFPEYIPQLSTEFLKNLRQLSNEEIAFHVIQPFVGDSINDAELLKIVAETVNFDFPLKQIEDNIYTLELFHGPTQAFKDVGARFMSRCLRSFVAHSDRKITILVATSGDTGGAVADAFFEVDGVEVIILFPSKKVSKLQELQLTTYGKNIRAFEIEGTFDDCQAIVKQSFEDSDLRRHYEFSSANSINIARWLSQQFYYFYAVQQWPKEAPPVISVPSGNFGNIGAGLMAYKSGLPIDSFIAACNENNAFTEYLQNGIYREKVTISTISNAMDVGNPSNFNRVLEVFDRDLSGLKKHVHSYSFSSLETANAIKKVLQETGYVMDPHGSVGYLALRKYLSEYPQKAGIFLETAHPAKFMDIVKPIAGDRIRMPEKTEHLFEKKQESTLIKADFQSFKTALLG